MQTQKCNLLSPLTGSIPSSAHCSCPHVDATAISENQSTAVVFVKPH